MHLQPPPTMRGKISTRVFSGNRRRRAGAAVALVVAMAVVVVIVLSSESPSTTNAASDSGITGATTVTQRNLSETDTESGTISYANPQTVYDRLGGTITWLPN